MPVFWGNPRKFMIIDAADGSKNLLAARWQSDRPNLAIVNSKKLEVKGYGYDGVPEGYPEPMVDHKAERVEALARYEQVKAARRP